MAVKKMQSLGKRKSKSDSDSSSSSESEEETIYSTDSESETEISEPKKTSSSSSSKKNIQKKKSKTSSKKKSSEKSSEKKKKTKTEESDENEEEEDATEESDDENDSDGESEKEYKKFLSKLFPSSKKSRKNSRSSTEEDEESDSEHDDSEEDESQDSSSESERIRRNKKKSKSKKHKKSSKKNAKKHKKSKKDSSSSSSSGSSSSESSENDSVEDENEINIIFSLGDEYENYFGSEEDEDEDEDEECNTDDEKTFMKETYEKVDAPESMKDKAGKKGKKDTGGKVKVKSKSTKGAKGKEGGGGKDSETKSDKSNENNNSNSKVDAHYKELLELKKDLTKKYIENPNKILKRAIKECRDSIHELIRSARKSNMNEYRDLLEDETKKPNEMNYFRKKLSNAEQRQVMKDLKEVNKHIYIDKPYRLALLQTKIPAKYKAFAMEKLNMLKTMDPGDNEYYKIKTWVDTFMRIPFCVNKDLCVKMSDGIDVCHNFMKDAKQILDECVFGLDDAKLQIMQMVGQWITNPSAMGTAIAIKGPPGTGKTTLVKEGISKLLGREFAFIPLGGTGDSSFLEGHSYTYEGSKWGKIVQILVDAKCMNPVIYFDELDKISDTAKGEEITGILTHLTDTTQNSQFHDKYFSEIDFDLSKCLFIFSYNDESRVNPILKDRMYRIETKGYDAKEKMIIARQYMLPKIREQVNFKEEDVIIPDDTLHYIITEKRLTHEEAGVRNMKRCLEIIHTKLNLFRLVKPDDNLFHKDIDIQVEFPITVTRKYVDILIKNDEKQSQSLLMMYC